MIKPVDKNALLALAISSKTRWLGYYAWWYEKLDGDWRAFEIQERSRYPRGHNISRQLKRARKYWTMLNTLEWKL